MTKDSDFKKLVRQRMAATGQSYTAARAAISRSAEAVDLPLNRRVFGLKTSYTAEFDGGRAPDGIGAGEYMFRQMIRGSAASNYLENGSRFCLRRDESGPTQLAYATPECDSIVELIAAELAGDEILARLANRTQESMTSEGSPAALAVSRLAAAQSESYLVASAMAAERYLRLLEPFLATRWICARADALPAPRAAMAEASFADSRYRRLKITGADPGLSQLATFLRVGITEQVLRLAESSAEVSFDHGSFTRPVEAAGIQRAYLAAARRIRRRPEDDIVLDAWQAALDSHDDDTLIATPSQIETAVDLPPQTTRARLRGLFIKTAKNSRMSFAVDWVHLKVINMANRTLLCRDPLDANFEQAQRLIRAIS